MFEIIIDLLYITVLIFGGFSIGFVVGSEWIQKLWTSKIPYHFCYKKQWYIIFKKEDIILNEPTQRPFHASQLKTWQGGKKWPA